MTINETMTVNFAFEAATKNKLRYQELGANGQRIYSGTYVGALYISKDKIDGQPATLRVTITPTS